MFRSISVVFGKMIASSSLVNCLFSLFFHSLDTHTHTLSLSLSLFIFFFPSLPLSFSFNSLYINRLYSFFSLSYSLAPLIFLPCSLREPKAFHHPCATDCRALSISRNYNLHTSTSLERQFMTLRVL